MTTIVRPGRRGVRVSTGLVAAAMSFALGSAPSAVAQIQFTATLLESTEPELNNSIALGVDGPVQVGSIHSFGKSDQHAALWRGSTNSLVDLHPSGYLWSILNDVEGDVQVGQARLAVNFEYHAMVWRSSAQSALDINPDGYEISEAFDTDGVAAVGHGFDPNSTRPTHALYWPRLDSNVAIDLTPEGFDFSQAFGISGDTQVGFASGFDGNGHGFLWHGSPESAVDLTPPGATFCEVLAVDGPFQVGHAAGPRSRHNSVALLWRGTPESVIVLHPPTWLFSIAQDVKVAPGGRIVAAGYGAPRGSNFRPRALVWIGSRHNFIDLHQYLPDGGKDFVYSRATAIDPQGGVVGFATRFDLSEVAVLWTPVR